jgi:transcriptional regulator with XRE-family HTH domain
MAARKTQLSEFLRKCRDRILPTDVGLPDRARRRTPGLRREDVAALAGVSVTWYTWLEQGRDIQVSADVLERIAATLRLSSTERDYLFALVHNRPPPLMNWRNAKISPAIQRMMERIAVPAIVMTSRWDVVAWNRLSVAIFRDYDMISAERRNLLRLLLVDEMLYPADSKTYRAMARRVVAKFRIDYSQNSDDPEFAELIEELSQESETFRELWKGTDVLGFSEAVVEYPDLGMTLEHTSYVPEGHPGLRLLVYTPCDDASAERVEAFRREIATTANPSELLASPALMPASR